MVVICRAFVVAVMLGIFVFFDSHMLADEIQEAQAVVCFVVVIVMGNECRNEGNGMRCFSRQGNRQDEKHDEPFPDTFHLLQR